VRLAQNPRNNVKKGKELKGKELKGDEGGACNKICEERHRINPLMSDKRKGDEGACYKIKEYPARPNVHNVFAGC
jgi:hypothetical protein